MPNKHLFDRRDALKLAALGALGLPLLNAAVSAAAENVRTAGEENRTRGLKLGLASFSLNALPAEAVIEALHQLQISNVSLFRTHVPWDGTAEQCRAAAQKFKDAGITITGSGVIYLPDNEAAVRNAFDNARAVGLPTMICKPALEAFPLIEKFVKEYDIRLAIHNHGPEDNLYPSPYDAWKVIQPYDPRIGLCIDVGHAMRAGTDPAEAIRKCAARLYDIHLKDSNAAVGSRDIPAVIGHGRMDIRGILAALIEIKYPRIVAFEYEVPSKDPVVGLAESVGFVRGLLANMPS